MERETMQQLIDLEKKLNIKAGRKNWLILGRPASGKTVFIKEEIKRSLNKNKGRICVFAHCPEEYEDLKGKRCLVYPFEQLQDWIGKINKKKANKVRRIYIDDAEAISDDGKQYVYLFKLAAKYNISVTAVYQVYKRVPEQVKMNVGNILAFLPYSPCDITVLSGEENESIADERFYSDSVLLIGSKKGSIRKVIISVL